MADQTARLEAATLRAEIGSGILFRFSNDTVDGGAIPTQSGDIDNLKKVILDIQTQGANKISFATTIYATTAAGIAATANGAIFLVRSNATTEIYAVYSNNNGTAVDTGKRALSSQAVQDATTAASNAAASAQSAANTATARVAGLHSPSANDPTTRDDGSALQIGDTYFNTGSQTSRTFTSSGWILSSINGNDLNAAISTREPTIPAGTAGQFYGADKTFQQVTKANVGLGSVDNTADTAKPVSTPQQTALNLKANLSGATFTGTVNGITKAMVDLGSVDNTSDVNKPVSNAMVAALGAIGVPTVTAMKAITTFLTPYIITMGRSIPGDGGHGIYRVDTADTTSVENGGTLFVSASGVRLKLLHNGITDLAQWDVVSNGTDQAAKIQAAINWAQTYSTVTEGVRGGLTYGPGKPITFSSSLKFDVPIFVDFKSILLYTPTTGSAIIFGSAAPTGSRYDSEMTFEGLRAVNGNSADPTGFPTSGSVGFEYRNQQFSNVRCKLVIAFTYANIWYNSTNNVYSGQHMQDNDHEYGIIGYGGQGILAQSTSAETGATQVTRIKVKNFVTNYRHMILGNQNGNDNNTNDLKIEVLAMERCTAPDGVGVEIRGFANNIQVEYADVPACKFVFAEPADANRLVVGNPGVSISSVCGPTKNNQWRTGHPNPGILPAAPTSAFNTPYTNTYGVPVMVAVAVSMTPTTSAQASATLYAGVSAAGLSEVGTEIVTAQTSPQTVQRVMSVIVQPGGAWQINKSATGTVNLASTSIRSIGM
jgi:hypothetical protein